MPCSYTVPAVGYYDEIYYFDTYFTNLGLALLNRWDLVKSNTDNMLYLVDKYGFMPNGNRTFFLGNSHPPFLSEIVRQVYEHYHDLAWLRGAYSVLCREYEFWQTKRITPIGLNQYAGTNQHRPTNVKAADFCRRIQYRPRTRPTNNYLITICLVASVRGTVLLVLILRVGSTHK